MFGLRGIKETVFAGVFTVCVAGGFATAPALAADLVPVDGMAWTVENPLTADLYLSTNAGPKQIPSSQIDVLQAYETTMTTPWDVTATFQGVLLDDLIDMLDLDPAEGIRLKAIDDYIVTFYAEELGNKDILFVTRMNGAPISLDDKGPFRLLMPALEGKVSDEDESTAKWIWAIEEIGATR
ncbi:MAG: molybdopterin-dependent oxidoreductase [Rhodospirillaceae bacterium]